MKHNNSNDWKLWVKYAYNDISVAEKSFFEHFAVRMRTD